AEVFRHVAEIARRNRVEVQRLTLARRFLSVRLDAVARGARPLQVVVALSEPEIDEFAIVAGCLTPERVEHRACRRIPLRAEEPLRAPEVELVAGAAERRW